MNQPATLVAIVGPTGTGKSALALGLAQRFGGEVINADSRQVYRGMEIGTVQPSAADRARVPHHLYGFVDPREGFSLAQFLDLAQQAVQYVHRRGRLPMVVGGTGQYVWALLEGWQVPRVPPNLPLRRQLGAEAQWLSPEALHQRLRQLDPEAAGRIDPRNVRRVIRALEVAQALGAPPSALRRRQPPAFRALILGLTTQARAELYHRLDRRVDALMAAGWTDEVRRLLEQGYAEDLPTFASAGYRELMLYIKQQLDLIEAIRRIKSAHHRLARRQYAWFRLADPRIHWLLVGSDMHDQAEELVLAFLGGASSGDVPPLKGPDGGNKGDGPHA